MFTFTLRRILNAEKTEVWIEYDGKEYDKSRESDRPGLYELSRQLTGTTGEKLLDNGYSDIGGVFNKTYSTLRYGTASKYFEWSELSLQNDAPEKIAESIAQRVREVREWVKSVQQDETHIITLEIEQL